MNLADSSLRGYLVVTLGYWGFTVTDGAIRMLVVLYFHLLGYSPLQVAMLFLFYELFGVITNLVGGWLGARVGLDRTMHLGMALQVCALIMLTVPDEWLSVGYVMAAQALSGIAKDLNKLSAKASVKLLLPSGAHGRLFRWVALLTGSKNALKGAGFFVGAALLQAVGFRGALAVLAAGLSAVLLLTLGLLPQRLGTAAAKPRFSQAFSHLPALNWLSAARFFLFGARDVWFVVGLPVYLYTALGWSFTQVGSYLALWIVGYGAIQALAPSLLRRGLGVRGPGPREARLAAAALAAVAASMALLLSRGLDPQWVLMVGLAVFGAIFAVSSALHSFLILAYADRDKAAMNVGFYYMANAGGRLAGTLLSGWVFQVHGLIGCLWWSAGFVALALMFSLRLPELDRQHLVLAP